MKNILKTIFLVFLFFVFLRFSPSPAWAVCNPRTDSVCVSVTSITSNLLGGGSGPQSPGESVNVTVRIEWDIGIDNLIVIYAAKMIDKGGGSDNDPSSYTSPSSGGANFNTTGNHTGVRSTTFTTTIQDAGAIPLCKRIYASPYVRVLFPNGSNWGSFFGTDTSIHSSCIGATLSVYVKNASGNAIEGARVDISNGGSSNPYRLTDANGFVKVWHLDCNYSTTITVSKSGYNTYSTTISGNTSPVRNGTNGILNVTLTIPSSSPSPSPSASPSPSPSSSPPANTVSLTSSCGPPALSASWNRGPGSTCNAYIQAGVGCTYELGSNCTGSWSGSTLPSPSPATCNTGLWDTWSGTLKVSNGTDDISDPETISCGGGGGPGCYNFKCKNDGPTYYNPCADKTMNIDPSQCTKTWCLANQFGNANCDPNGTVTCTSAASNACNPNPSSPPSIPACDASQVNMSFSPLSLIVGQPIAFTVSGTQGYTHVGDTWTPSGGSSTVGCTCTTGTSNNACGFWGSKTCNTIAANSYRWTHYWKNCRPNTNCQPPNNVGPQCSKPLSYTVTAPITPWIQVTGDVHSNVRIYAPGGP